jgi:enamine deaminase RidA (YjgF/YER057c/UK114 family)
LFPAKKCYTESIKEKEESQMEFKRENIKGGSAYEDVAGYSRVVKAGPFVYVSGTTSVTPEGTVYGEGDPYEQAKYIFTKLVKLLEDNGVSREEVVKVNIFATSSSYNNEITKAYSEYFKESRPCCTWIGIKELNRPSQLVEIEMQAIIGAKA